MKTKILNILKIFKLESEDKNKLIAYIKPLMINATDRNTINHDNYQFYFNKLLTSKGIKLQNDVLTQEIVKADGFRLASTFLGIIGTCFMIYVYMIPDTAVKTVGHVATSASNILNRASTLVNGTCPCFTILDAEKSKENSLSKSY